MKCLAFFCVVLTLFTVEALAKSTLWHKKNLLKSKSILSKPTEVAALRSENGKNSADAREYMFLKDSSGKVIIMDARFFEQIITTYSLPEISESIVAIVNDTFYNIDTQAGKIMSTAVENIVSGPNNVNWAHVGSFPAENGEIYNSVAVNYYDIYFVTRTGLLYIYDTTMKTVTKLGTTGTDNWYASLVIVDDILYIYHLDSFFSFDGDELKKIDTGVTLKDVGLYKLNNLVCLVGGNETDIGSNADAVECYNPGAVTWHVTSYINQFRHYPGVTETELGTCIFGGWAIIAEGDDYPLETVEIRNSMTQIWSFIPSPLTTESLYVQAVTFYF